MAGLGSTSGLPPFLVLIDTEDVGGTPTDTTFYLSSKFTNCETLFLLSEQGAHEPSPEESLAPFYPDPAQRVVVLQMQSATCYLVVSVGALLELNSRGGTEIEWHEWRDHVVIACPFTDETLRPSGPRMPALLYFFNAVLSGSPDADARFQLVGTCPVPEQRSQSIAWQTPVFIIYPARAQISWDGLIEPRSDHGSILIPHVSLIVHILFFSGM